MAKKVPVRLNIFLKFLSLYGVLDLFILSSFPNGDIWQGPYNYYHSLEAVMGDQSFSSYAKFSEELSFLSFSEYFAYVLNQ